MKKLFIITKDTEGVKVARVIDSPTDHQIAEVAAARWYLNGKRYPSEVCKGLENVVAVVRAFSCGYCGKVYTQPTSAWDWYEKGTVISDVMELIKQYDGTTSTDYWYAVPDEKPVVDVCESCFSHTDKEILAKVAEQQK